MLLPLLFSHPCSSADSSGISFIIFRVYTTLLRGGMCVRFVWLPNNACLSWNREADGAATVALLSRGEVAVPYTVIGSVQYFHSFGLDVDRSRIVMIEFQSKYIVVYLAHMGFTAYGSQNQPTTIQSNIYGPLKLYCIPTINDKHIITSSFIWNNVLEPLPVFSSSMTIY